MTTASQITIQGQGFGDAEVYVVADGDFLDLVGYLVDTDRSMSSQGARFAFRNLDGRNLGTVTRGDDTAAQIAALLNRNAR